MSSREHELLDLNFARALRAARAHADSPDGGGREMTQEELGAAVGVNRSQVSNWETGKNQPPGRQMVRRLEHALGVTDFDLMLNAGYHPLDWPELELDQQAQVKIFLRHLSDPGRHEGSAAGAGFGPPH